METRKRLLLIAINLVVGVGLLYLVDGRKSPARDFAQAAALFGVCVAAVLWFGTKTISPAWPGWGRLAGTLAMALAGVAVFTLAIVVLMETRDPANLHRQIRQDGWATVAAGFFLRQAALTLGAALVGFPVWVPLWLLDFYWLGKPR